MDLKFSANAGFLGGIRDRFNQQQPDRDVRGKFELAKQIEGLHGIELRYPNDFDDVTLVKDLLDQSGLALSAVNVNTKPVEYFGDGALSAPSEAAREQALKWLREGMDLAAEMGTDLVTTCPLAEGYDYPFQIDYTTVWPNFIDTVKQAVSYRSDINLLLEYQPHDPHAKILLNNVGKMLYVCSEVDAPNFGANLDIGHSFAALESPAEAAALLAGKNRLFYIHSNDNTGDGGDWDMISGAVHFWHWLELLYTLDKIGYTGWCGADVVAKHGHSPVKVFHTNFLMIQRMNGLLERIGPDKIGQMIANRAEPAEVYEFLSTYL
jgi:xylose isomerase